MVDVLVGTGCLVVGFIAGAKYGADRMLSELKARGCIFTKEELAKLAGGAK